jgi:hypothetical protein
MPRTPTSQLYAQRRQESRPFSLGTITARGAYITLYGLTMGELNVQFDMNETIITIPDADAFFNELQDSAPTTAAEAFADAADGDIPAAEFRARADQVAQCIRDLRTGLPELRRLVDDYDRLELVITGDTTSTD